MSWSFAEVNKPLIQKVNKSLLALFSFEVVDFANTSANLHLHENHNKNKRWRAMRLHFPDINGTNPVKLKSDLKHGHKGVVNCIFRRAFELNQELFTRNHI